MSRHLPVFMVLLAAYARAQGQPEALPAFEVASVHITAPAQFGYTSFSPFGTNRYTATNATLDFLVQLAYGVPFYQISGIEKLGTQHYDLAAKAEDGVLLTPQTLQPRLRRFLEERFHLAAHRDQKMLDGYELVVAKGGPKLKPSNGASGQGEVYPGGLRLLNTGLDTFAGTLRSPAGRPVVDKTGIEGKYDFELSYARDGDADTTLPSFFTALQEKYGLKLQPAKVPVDVVVIDRVEKVPTEN